MRLKRSSSRECITPLGLLQQASFVSRTTFSSAPPQITHGMMQHGHSIQTIRCSNLHMLIGHTTLTLQLPRAITFPIGLMRPILAVPVGDRLRCLGLALYGPHATGNALSHEERSMLAELADKAASAFMQINDDQLRRRIATLESELATIAGAFVTTR